MLYNHASTIIINLLFFNFDKKLRTITNAENIAISPLMECPFHSMQVQMGIRLRVSSKEFVIHISMDNFSSNESVMLKQVLADMSHDLNISFNVIFKKYFSVAFEPNHQINIYTAQFRELVISTTGPDFEKSIRILIPFYFFRLFSNSISPVSSTLTIENEILGFFKNPKWMLPDIPFLFNSLTRSELTKLLNHLQMNNLLTPYQIFLFINAFPELSSMIKSTLSQNCINDVINFNKNKKLKITRRDIAGGIYSIAESLLMLFRDGFDLNYSMLMRHIQCMVQLSLNIDLLLKKNFIAWLKEMETRNLLYPTIAITEDAVVAAAISREENSYLPMLEQHVTQRKIGDIRELLNPALSYDKIMEARIIFISNYRNLRMRHMDVHPDRFGYLLSSFSNPEDYQYLLFSNGWFILSTALKGISKKIIPSVMVHLPFQAQILIEDVLKGIVNPNILHDEMQINKARIHCVSSILQLYHDGLINLE